MHRHLQRPRWLSLVFSDTSNDNGISADLFRITLVNCFNVTNSCPALGVGYVTNYFIISFNNRGPNNKHLLML